MNMICLFICTHLSFLPCSLQHKDPYTYLIKYFTALSFSINEIVFHIMNYKYSFLVYRYIRTDPHILLVFAHLSKITSLGVSI